MKQPLIDRAIQRYCWGFLAVSATLVVVEAVIIYINLLNYTPYTL